jgi:hypothetical protein
LQEKEERLKVVCIVLAAWRHLRRRSVIAEEEEGSGELGTSVWVSSKGIGEG